MNKRVSDEVLKEHLDACEGCLELDGCGCSDMVREYNESSPKEQAKWTDPPTYCTECQWWIDEKALFVELQERRAGDAERDAEIERKSLVNKNLRMSIEIMQDNADVEIDALKAELTKARGTWVPVAEWQKTNDGEETISLGMIVGWWPEARVSRGLFVVLRNVVCKWKAV